MYRNDDRRDRRERSPERRERRRSRSRSPRRSRSPPRRRGNYGDDRRDGDGRWKKNEKASTCVGVFGLDWETTERELERKFTKYGRIKSATLVWNHRERRNKGFGFVTFEEMEAAAEAVRDMNGRTIEGRAVRVDFSYTKHGNKEHMYDSRGERKPEFRDRDRERRSSRSPPRRRASRSPRRASRSPPARRASRSPAKRASRSGSPPARAASRSPSPANGD